MIKSTRYVITTEDTGSEVLVEHETDRAKADLCEIKISCPDAEQFIWLTHNEAAEVAKAIIKLTETKDNANN